MAMDEMDDLRYPHFPKPPDDLLSELWEYPWAWQLGMPPEVSQVSQDLPRDPRDFLGEGM